MSLSSLLFQIRILSFFNTRSKKGMFQFLIFIFFGILVLASIFGGTWFLLHKLDTLNSKDQYSTILNMANQWILVGDLIKERLFSMVAMAVLFMLLFSNILSSLSHLFASQDTELLLQSPISHKKIFQTRFLESILASSWMSIFFFLPVLFAYTLNYHTSFYRIFPFFFALIPFLLIPACIANLFTLFLVRWFPIQKTQKIFQFLSVFFLTLLILLIRMLQPEKLFSIQNHSEIQKFIENLQNPLFETLPSSWLSKITLSLLNENPAYALKPALYLFLCATFFFLLAMFAGTHLWYHSFIRSQEIRPSQIVSSTPSLFSLPAFLPDSLRAIYKKDILIFIRNPELWSQIFLILAMVALYLYNIHLLHLDQISLQLHSVSRFVSILNVAFVGFITTSISMRFLFPAISMEGKAFWILKTSPFALEKLILYKFFFYLPWILIMGNLMTFLANWILRIPTGLYILNAFNISVFCIVNSLLAVSLGTLFPNYRAENINKIFMSFGGTIFMLLSLGFMLLWFFCQGPWFYFWYISNFRGLILTSKHFLILGISVIFSLILLYLFTFFFYQKAMKTLKEEEVLFL